MEDEDVGEIINTFYDGASAREHHVKTMMGDVELTILGDTLVRAEKWGYEYMRLVTDLSNHKGASFRLKDHLGRLNIHDPEFAKDIKARCPNLKKSDISKSSWNRIGIWGAGAVASVVLIIFVIIPALANQLATMIPVDREIALGKGSLKQIERFIGYGYDKKLTCSGSKGQLSLQKMASRLPAHTYSP